MDFGNLKFPESLKMNIGILSSIKINLALNNSKFNINDLKYN